MTRRQLVAAFREARRIHVGWAHYQAWLRSQGRRPLRGFDGARWHERWVRIYDAALRELA